LDWAGELGAIALRQTRAGLNGAVSDARDEAASRGCEWVLVTHADLVDPTPLASIVSGLHRGVVTLVPDRHEDGTNVLALDCGVAFDTHYGPGSFRAHLTEAERRGLVVEVVRDQRLALDVDEPGDLADLDGF
ncbi:MAG: 2-phospho-L-lactate guanylyltransferase, partial [Actinomycetota bacterium]